MRTAKAVGLVIFGVWLLLWGSGSAGDAVHVLLVLAIVLHAAALWPRA